VCGMRRYLWVGGSTDLVCIIVLVNCGACGYVVVFTHVSVALFSPRLVPIVWCGVVPCPLPSVTDLYILNVRDKC
jgi:hypothetical protein